MKLYDKGVYLVNSTELVEDTKDAAAVIKEKTGEEVSDKSCIGRIKDKQGVFPLAECSLFQFDDYHITPPFDYGIMDSMKRRM